MSILIDSGVFVAQQNRRDEAHDAAVRALDAVLSGRYGQAFTSDYVFDEAVTLARRRTKSHAEMMTLAHRILGMAPFPRVFEVLMVTGPVFRDAVRVLERYTDRDLSFTDATTIALVQRRGIGRVLSFDADFDGIVPRVDPRKAA